MRNPSNSSAPTAGFERMGKYGNLLKNIVIFGVGTFLTKLVQFFLLPLYTSQLSTDAYATGELLNNFAEAAYPICTLCLYEAVFRFSLSSKYNRTTLLSYATKEHLCASLLILGISVVVYLITNNFLAIGFSLLFSMSSFRQILAFYARGAGYTTKFAFSGLVNAMFLAMASWYFIVILRLGATGYVLGLVVGYLASAIFILVTTDAVTHIRLVNSTDNDTFKEMLKYSVPLIGTNIAFWVSTMSGRYILAWIAGAGAAGLFLAASKLSAAVNMIQQVFYYSFQINSSREYEREADIGFLSRTYWLFSAGLTIVCSMMVCILPLISGYLLQGDFSIAEDYLPLTLYAAYVDCLFCYFKSFYTSFKETKQSLRSTLVGAVVNVVLCFALIPALEIWGALLALLTSNFAVGVVRALDTKKFIAIDQKWGVNGPALALFGVQVMILSVWGDSAMHASMFILCLIAAVYMVSYRNALLRGARRLFGRNNGNS